MKNWKRLLALLLSGVMTLSLCACGTAGSSESPSAESSAEPAASATLAIVADLTQGPLEFSAGLSASDVVLTVNGADIPADLFLYLLAQSCGRTQQNMAMFGMSLSDMPEMAPDLLEQGIQLAVYHTLLRQKAAELGCLPTDAQNREINDAMEQADLASSSPYWGLTDESARFIFSMNTYYNNVLDAATHDPTAEELEDYIIAQGAYRVKHILLKTVDDNRQPLPDDQIAEKRTQAEALLAELQAAADLPALFDQRMNELSEDGRDESTGALYAPDGYLATPGQMVSAFEEASQALQPGELSGLVETEYGYHIILRLSLTPLTEDETASYTDNFRPSALTDLLEQWTEASEVTTADALLTLNAVDFYTKLAAYQQALSERDAPVESGGVG